VPCLYVILRWLWALTMALELKVGIATLLLVGCQFHLWARLSSGSMFAPEFPHGLVVIFSWVIGAIMMLAVFQLVLDIGWLASAPIRYSCRPAPEWSRWAIAAVAMSLAAVAVWNAVRVPPVRDVDVHIPNLPRAFEGYRIVQLADMHISRLFPASWVRQVVERTNAARPDLIVITGDFVDGSVGRRVRDIEPLRDLRGKDGVYAVPGNHEYYFDYPDWMRRLTALGIRILPNAHDVIERAGDRITIAGVTDPSASGFGQAGPDLAKAVKGAPSNAPIILLDHQPKKARAAEATGISLQLSGHTHGGMMAGFDRLVGPPNAGFVSGLYKVGGMALYVGNGTGIWPGFALRLGRPSEITRITLHRS
jgi:predicted MPP superfamily phosphohydrolase